LFIVIVFTGMCHVKSGNTIVLYSHVVSYTFTFSYLDTQVYTDFTRKAVKTGCSY